MTTLLKVPELEAAERLIVWTTLGEREVQLCFGDITSLTASQEKVDFVMVSAFLGDYTPIYGTVIGALKRNLDIDVRKLAKHKQEDLRHQCHCWISEKLRPECPYRQLICFERTKRDVRMEDAVQDVFRAIMPACNNQNKSVITPILASGHQHADESIMLETMVYVAAKWMVLGMPLQTFKIVIYTQPGNEPDARLLDIFRKAKKKIEKRKNIPQEPDIIVDIFLIYADQDSEWVFTFVKYVKKHKIKVNLKTIKDISLNDKSWLHDLSEVLMTVARVVPVLTSQFLSEAFCIDQFNVALCCNRRTRRDLLAPVLMEKVALPIYMNMVQWVNCRNRTDEQYDDGALSIINQIKHKASAATNSQYDVFISYSHKNIDVAKKLLCGFEKLKLKPRIFFDYQELTTGVSWQQTLYNALDASRCVLALISPEYQISPVCQEEFNLALAKHFNKRKCLELVPIYIAGTDDTYLDELMSPVKLDKDMSITDITTVLESWLSDGSTPHIFNKVDVPIDLQHDSATLREDIFSKYYVMQHDIFTITQSLPEIMLESQSCDVYISHSIRDQKYATFLHECLKSENKDLKVISKLNIANNEGSLINEARCIVVLLSSVYINSTKEVEEFNIILSRARTHIDGNLLYVVQISGWSTGPTYFRLVAYDTSIMDEFWWQYSKDHNTVWKTHKSQLDLVKKQLGSSLSQGELCPLLKVVCDVLMIIKFGRYLNNEHSDIILNNVLKVHQKVVDLNKHPSGLIMKQAEEDSLLHKIERLDLVDDEPGHNDQLVDDESLQINKIPDNDKIDDEFIAVGSKNINQKCTDDNNDNPRLTQEHSETKTNVEKPREQKSEIHQHVEINSQNNDKSSVILHESRQNEILHEKKTSKSCQIL